MTGDMMKAPSEVSTTANWAARTGGTRMRVSRIARLGRRRDLNVMEGSQSMVCLNGPTATEGAGCGSYFTTGPVLVSENHGAEDLDLGNFSRSTVLSVRLRPDGPS